MAAPYADSSYITSITWDFAGQYTLAPGSDLWPFTWSNDGHVYTSWGDGGGFGGTNTLGRDSLGFARIEGHPDDPLEESGAGQNCFNVWGGHNSENPDQFDGKGNGIISIGGTLYCLRFVQPVTGTFSDNEVIYSADKSATWNIPSWAFTGAASAWVPISFLNFGQDNANARDSYVYCYGQNYHATSSQVLAGTNAYMARVPSTQILTEASWEWYTGPSGGGYLPTWSSTVANRTPVFVDPLAENDSIRPTVIYNIPLDRYILTATSDGELSSHWGVFDAPEPWGPWTTVAYYDASNPWAGCDPDCSGDQTLQYTFCPKWTSSDGLTMWMSWSSSPNADAFYIIKATLTVNDTIAPDSPTGLTVI